MKHEQKNVTIYEALRYTWNVAPGGFVEMIVIDLLNCLLAVISVWATKQLLSSVQYGYGTDLYCILAVYGIILVLSSGYSVWYIRYRLQFQVIMNFEQKIRVRLHRKADRISNEALETPQAYSMIRQADNARQNLFRYVEICIRILVTVIQAFAVTAYVSSFQVWFLLLLPMAALPLLLKLFYQARLWKKHFRAVSQYKQEEAEYQKAMVDEAACKESRLSNALCLLTQKWNHSRSERDTLENEKSIRMFGLRLMLTPMEMLGMQGGFLISVILLYLGKIDYTAFAAGIAAYAALISALNSLAETIGEEAQFRQMIQPYFRYQKLSERGGDSTTCSLKQEIRLEHVSFRYPNQEKNAIDDINLTLHKGEILAIVGENGAGKSTLANLILGLYQPGSGRICYDGVDIATVRESVLHKGQSSVMQHFARYKMTVGDNIAISDFGKKDVQELKRRTAELFHDSQIFMDTVLGKEFGGRELSGGQWQQLSCERGFYKDSDFLVMDEATSAIDPLKEKAMYDRFRKELRGKTGIIITHRLSAVSLADRIIVLKQGRIAQSGTHDQLLKEDGLYARFWESQTKPFAGAENSF